MSGTRTRMAFTLLIMALASGPSAHAAATGGTRSHNALQPITNSSFERVGDRGIPVDWEVVGGKAIDGDAHSGRRSLRLVHGPERKYTYFNRRWKLKNGKQGAMLDVLKGKISYWYKAVSADRAELWLGLVPMSRDPWENTGSRRTGITIPPEHIGDGKWHQAVVTYDYTGNNKVKWVHTSCFINGQGAELLVDDVERVFSVVSVARMELIERQKPDAMTVRATVQYTGNIATEAKAAIFLPKLLSLAPGEKAAKVLFDIQPGRDKDYPVEWRIAGSPYKKGDVIVTAQTMAQKVGAKLALASSRDSFKFSALEARSIPRMKPSRASAEPAAPPVPQWLLDITQVAYTDLPNIVRVDDWPERVIADLGEMGVQMLFSRAHSGENWQGVAWNSACSNPDSTMKGRPIDWQVSKGWVTDEDAHSGKRSLRLVHDPERKQTYLNRAWQMRNGQQGAMLDVLEGKVSYWYKALSGKDAKLWLGIIPMSKDPVENTGEPRTGATVPAQHVGDGKWHQVVISYDYTQSKKVKWVHTSCFISGQAAEILLDDIEYVGKTPQPITNSGFEATEPDRDGTREVVDLCHKHGMKYIAYFWALLEPPDVHQAHPEWKCLNSRGKPTGRFCYNNPAYREFMKKRFVELVRDYGVDGIMMDMFHAYRDENYCPACKGQFRELTGKEPPIEEDFDSLLWQEWVNFRYRGLEQAMLGYNMAIKAANPEAAFIVNSWNAWGYRRPGVKPHSIRNSIRVAENVDGMLEELGWYDTADASFFAFPARHNFMSWHLAGLHKRRPGFAWSHPSEIGLRAMDANEARIRVMAMMTNGSVPAPWTPGRDVAALYAADIAEREPYFRRARMFPWCGLVVSEKTELWYGRDDPKGRYVKGIYGAFQAMLERHLPVSLVTDRDLEKGLPEDYKVLLMPNCAAMSDAEMETVRRFVRNGGGLVATYETSRYDENGWPRDNLGLADVLNVKRVAGNFDNTRIYGLLRPGCPVANLHFSSAHPWSSDDVILKTRSRRALVTPAGRLLTSVPLLCRMLLVEPTQMPPSPLWLKTTAHWGQSETQTHPAVIESTYGKGKVIYVPFDVSWSFFRTGHEFLARIIELALRDAAAEPAPVAVKAPTIVQTMTHCQGDRLVVHLLNDISSLGRSQNVVSESLYMRREVIPIHDIEVTFRDKAFRRFLLIPGKVELTPTPSAEGLTVHVPRLDIHCMVVAEK